VLNPPGNWQGGFEHQCRHHSYRSLTAWTASLIADSRLRRAFFLDCDDYELPRAFPRPGQAGIVAWWKGDSETWEVSTNTWFIGQIDFLEFREKIVYVSNGVIDPVHKPPRRSCALKARMSLKNKRIIAYIAVWVSFPPSWLANRSLHFASSPVLTPFCFWWMGERTTNT